MGKTKVLVIGCGVIGLTTGLILLNDDHDVTILTKDIPPNTTSNMAGAFWYPCLEEPASSFRNQLALSTNSYVHEHILPNSEEAGCVERMIDIFYQSEDMVPHNESGTGFKNFKPIESSIAKLYGCIGGYSFQSYVVDTDVYLNYLFSKFSKDGGKLVMKDLTSNTELINIQNHYDAVVNCSGLGAETIFGDSTVVPIRGQTILANPVPGYDRILYIDCAEPAYIIPRITDCVLGGTYEVGNSNLNVDQEVTQKILNRVALFGVKEVITKRVKVGIRPGRPTVRLEKDVVTIQSPSNNTKTIPVVHNYGHGGRGFTLSWGCALKSAEIIKESLK